MSNPIRQHYVPKSYLRFFSEGEGEKSFVWTRKKNSDVSEYERRSINNICLEKNLYTFPDEVGIDSYFLEKYYARKIDGEFPRIIRDKLLNPQVDDLTAEEKELVISLFGCLFFRSPKPLTAEENEVSTDIRLIGEKLKVSKRNQPFTYNGESWTLTHYNYENVEAQVRGRIKMNYLNSHFEQWKKFVAQKSICKIDVAEVSGSYGLITSDCPVDISRDHGNRNSFGDPFDPYNFIRVPLDRTHFLTIFPEPESKYGNSNKIHRSNWQMDIFAFRNNAQTEENCIRWTLGSLRDLQKFDHAKSDVEQNEIMVQDANIISNAYVEVENWMKKYGVKSAVFQEKLRRVLSLPQLENDSQLRIFLLD